MKFLLCLIVLFALPNSGQAQKKTVEPAPCLLTEAPVVRGFQLGQSIQDIRSVAPSQYDSLKRLRDDYGVTSFIMPAEVSPDRFRDIEKMSLTYFDDRLVSLEIRYKPRVDWQSNLHFASAIAEELKLPREGWRNRDPSYLPCQGFRVEVASSVALGAGRYPRLRLIDTHFADALAARKAEVEARKRAQFKP